MSVSNPTLVEREPTLVIVTAVVVLLNALLSVLFSFVTLDPGQVAAIYGVSNPLGALAAALLSRGRTTPWQPIEVPTHGIDAGWASPSPSAPGINPEDPLGSNGERSDGWG